MFDSATAPEAHTVASQARPEFVLQVRGLVGQRPPESLNPDLPTGGVEVRASVATVLNPAKTTPIYISKEGGEDEMLRLKYRYLDLRRERMRNNLVLRHRMIKFIRDFLNIRNNPSGTDYSGRVLLTLPLQITDKNNAAETPEPATVQPLSIPVPVDCVTTIDTTIGGTCSVSTTLDSIVPNTVVENQRSNWEVGQVQVRDAGPNGTGYASCPPTCGDGDEATFMRAGIFTP